MKKILTLLLSVIVLQGFAQIEYSVCGTPVTNTEYPVNANYGYGRSAYIIQNTVINKGGQIIRIGWMFDTGANDSIPVKIYLIDLTMGNWVSQGTWAQYSGMAGLTMVFDGKVKPAGNQICFIDLDTPFMHDSTKNLAVMVESNYGGTGLPTHPTQSNETISPTTNKHQVWYANSSPPTGNGSFIGYLPVTWLVFLKETGSPVGTINGRPLCGHDSLYWTNNANNDSVIILFNHTGIKPYLVNGTTYNGYGVFGTAGDTIVFKGKASNWVHSNVKPTREYNYYIWHFNNQHKYSASKKRSLWSAKDSPGSWDFDGGSGMPSGWSELEFENLPGHGFVDQGLSIHFTSSVVIGWFRTINICGITPNTHLSFKYRVVSDVSYPGNPVPANDIGMISVTISTDNSGTTQVLHQINSTNHTPSSSFQTITIPIGAYSIGKPVVIQVSCLKGTGSYYMDFDNFMLTEITGTSELPDREAFEVYPNPAGSVLHVMRPGSYPEGCSYQILGLSGNLILEGSMGGENSAIDVSGLSQGMYLIRLGHENKVSYRRWIKQ